MSTEEISGLIEAATKKHGGLRALGRLIEIDPSALIAMKKGNRPANWKVRAKLKAVLGAGTARAYIEAAAEELSLSDREDERKAATELIAILAALSVDDVERAMGIEPTS